MRKKKLIGTKLLATSLLLSSGIALSGGRAYATELDTEVIVTNEGSEQKETETCYELSEGVLTLKGTVDRETIIGMGANAGSQVKHIVAAEGTLLPSNCELLFSVFINCRSIDLSKADTSKVTNMQGMFAGLSILESIDLSSFMISEGTDTERMFFDSYSIKVLKLGEGFKKIEEEMDLYNGYNAEGWALGSETGEKISGDNEQAAFENEGTNTYYRVIIKDGISEETFPSADFRSYIRKNIDTNKDGNLSEEEIAAVTDVAVCDRQLLMVDSLQGIEVFKNLKNLNWDTMHEGITLDLSKNPELTKVYVYAPDLSSLDVTALSKLERLSISSDVMKEIDLSKNPELKVLTFEETPLTKIDLSANTKLEGLTLSDCRLTELDVTMLPKLRDLCVDLNELQEIDLSGNPDLEILSCVFNHIKELDLSANTKLNMLYCASNDLDSLCIMDCPELVKAYRCNSWQYECLISRKKAGQMVEAKGDAYSNGNVNQFSEMVVPVGAKIIDGYFKDVAPDAWYAAAVNFVKKNNFMTGTSETTFKPDDTLTRSQFVKVIYNVEGMPEVEASNVFEDVADGQWYTDAVIWAAGKKITSGISEKNFGTDLSITREQLATMLYRYAAGKNITYMHIEENAIAKFPDADQIDSWAKEGMMWAVTNGIMNGKKGSDDKNYLDPKGTATRAECAQMIKNLKENLMK